MTLCFFYVEKFRPHGFTWHWQVIRPTLYYLTVAERKFNILLEGLQYTGEVAYVN